MAQPHALLKQPSAATTVLSATTALSATTTISVTTPCLAPKPLPRTAKPPLPRLTTDSGAEVGDLLLGPHIAVQQHVARTVHDAHPVQGAKGRCGQVLAIGMPLHPCREQHTSWCSACATFPLPSQRLTVPALSGCHWGPRPPSRNLWPAPAGKKAEFKQSRMGRCSSPTAMCDCWAPLPQQGRMTYSCTRTECPTVIHPDPAYLGGCRVAAGARGAVGRHGRLHIACCRLCLALLLPVWPRRLLLLLGSIHDCLERRPARVREQRMLVTFVQAQHTPLCPYHPPSSALTNC